MPGRQGWANDLCHSMHPLCSCCHVIRRLFIRWPITSSTSIIRWPIWEEVPEILCFVLVCHILLVVHSVSSYFIYPLH